MNASDQEKKEPFCSVKSFSKRKEVRGEELGFGRIFQVEERKETVWGGGGHGTQTHGPIPPSCGTARELHILNTDWRHTRTNADIFQHSKPH